MQTREDAGVEHVFLYAVEYRQRRHQCGSAPQEHWRQRQPARSNGDVQHALVGRVGLR